MHRDGERFRQLQPGSHVGHRVRHRRLERETNCSANPGTATIIATSKQDPAQSGQATIAVTAMPATTA